MLTVAFFLYNFISLYISSAVSIKLKDIKDVERVNYINNIALLLIVAILVMSISTSLTLRYGCATQKENVHYNSYSLVAIITLNLFLNGIYIAIVANPQFKNCPSDVRQLLITALVLNIIGTLIGIAFATYQMKKSHTS